MFKMKKVACFVTVLAMVFAMGMTSFAEEHVGPASQSLPAQEQPVQQQEAQPAAAAKVYKGPAQAALEKTEAEAAAAAAAEAAAAAAAAYIDPVTQAAGRPNPYHHTCIEIDITNQSLYAYDGEVLILASPCVTGLRGVRDTSAGDWQVNAKETNRYLQGYNSDGSRYKSWVNFWMPFHGGQGMHDAGWRGVSHANYGGSIYTYDGSHGCVNLPYDMAERLYNFAWVGMPVHIHY